MHLEETYTGIMRVASNRDGKPYKDGSSTLAALKI
mgnify:CR=1 FL=1